MTPGILFALGAMLCFGVADVMLQTWIFAPAINIYAYATGTLDVHWSAAWGSLAGTFSLIAVYNFARSLKDGAVSTNAPIFRLNFALTALLAIVFLGETLTFSKAGALVSAFVAVWLLFSEPGAAKSGVKLGSLTRVLVATVALALANLFYKVGLQDGALPETMISAQAWSFCSLATLLAFLQERRLRLTPAVWPYSVPAALAMLLASMFLMYGLQRGPASVLVPVAQMSFVFTAVAGALMFGEKLNTRKRLGLLTAVLALALFAVS
jgi:uncharacterized membrane protein